MSLPYDAPVVAAQQEERHNRVAEVRAVGQCHHSATFTTTLSTNHISQYTLILDMYYVCCLWAEKINEFTVITMINNCYRYVLQVCSQEAVPYVPKMDNPLGTGHIMVADHLAFSLIPKSASTTMLRFFCLYLGPRCTYGLDKPPHVHVLP